MKAELAVVLLLLTQSVMAAEKDLSPGDVFRLASQSVVVVNTYDATGQPLLQGSGVALKASLALTNCHVLRGASTITVTAQKRTYPASVRRSDEEHDLCSLSVPGSRIPAAIIGATSGLSIGDKVYSIGAPRGLDLTFSDGLISGFRAIDDGRILQTTAAIFPGSSGGGLFDARGQLVGITTMYLKDSQGLNFAVPIEWGLALASDSSGKLTSDIELTDKQKAARNQLVQFDVEMQAKAPQYMSLRPQLDIAVREIRRNYPPSEWLTRTKQAYAHLVSAQAAADEAAAIADATGTPANSGTYEGIPIRLLMADRAQTACKAFVIADTEIANTVADSTSTPLSALCECAATDIVSRTSDNTLSRIQLEEGPERAAFADALLQSLSTCVLMQDQ